MSRWTLGPTGWYPAAVAAVLFGVAEGTILCYCREGILRGTRQGARRRWEILGVEILERLHEHERGVGTIDPRSLAVSADPHTAHDGEPPERFSAARQESAA
ncbi:hypothetical protein HY634_03235 [Candidatus Uhrbacteria bacterium]|nr:hypothetical protein [Candidatus Uhrbacteria bacterium]